MWGDPERAASMEQGSDQLATLLFQISSPAHIPWGDQRWQEVLHGYDVWVHIDADNPLMERACQSMTKHAELSSNLAALTLHVTRMLRDLVHDIRTLQAEAGRQSTSRNEEALVADFSKRISSVAKARATAGALNLLRLLCHPVIVEASKDPHTSVNTINDVFTYQTRGDLAANQAAGLPLMHSLLDFISILGTRTATSTTSSSTEEVFDILHTPEIYDAAIFAFHLFFVLCGTQLYQPFYSSFESNTPCHYFIDELFRQTKEDNDTMTEDESHNSQFWSSNKSVGSSSTRSIGNGSGHRSKRRNRHKQRRNHSGRPKTWTPKAILETCLGWQLERPQAPDRSISQYYYILAQAAVNAKGGEKPGQDGLYENYMVVQATAPSKDALTSDIGMVGNESGDNKAKHGLGNGATQTKKKSFIVDTTKGILTLSGSIIFLPFRLLNLMYGVFTTNKNGSHELNRAIAMKKLANPQYSRTRDVLWLSDSLLADLACSAILFFASNNRNGEKCNIFRTELKHLTDNRWDHGTGGSNLPDLPSFRFGNEEGSEALVNDPKQSLSVDQQQRIMPFAPASGSGDAHLTVNFESLFVSFGRTLHNELGALLLYTIMQSSPSFAEWIGVRSDMDSIVMPLLRTLYFAFRSNTFMAKDFGTKKGAHGTTKGKSGTAVSDIRDCPFRSDSQLYVIIILLLLFSQDSSFGRDVFRRVTVVNVPWYKERTLKGINLGSVIILTLLRSLIFNLNRLSDVFLLNNCLAVLENLSPSVADLHEYAAMRLVSVTVLLMKKHAKLALREKGVSNKQNEPLDEDNSSDPLDMYSEATRTLLGIIKHGLSTKNIESNAHLIYALVYHQVDFLRLCKTKYSVAKKNGTTSTKKLYSSKQIARITSVIASASELIQGESARSAPKVLKVIEREMSHLKGVIVAADQEIASKRKKYNNHLPDDVHGGVNGKDDDVDDMAKNATAEEEFTFLYEEEADPEVFFVPYLWDLIVCVVTAGSMEWKKDDIKAFALLDAVDEQALAVNESVDPEIPTSGNFSDNAEEMV